MITAADLLQRAGLEAGAVVPWGTRVPCSHPGVYVIESERVFDRAPISRPRVEAWLARASRLTLDRMRPTADELIERLATFWLSQTRVLYVGQTTSRLDLRLDAFFRHELGRRAPHRGGHWIKALESDAELRVWWGFSARPMDDERRILQDFGGAEVGVLPFANLRNHLGALRAHGLRYQTGRPTTRNPVAVPPSAR